MESSNPQAVINVHKHRKSNIYERSQNCCYLCKAVSITHSECVFLDLIVQHAKRMYHVMLSSVAGPTVPHFSTLFHKWHDFREKVTERKT
jgi:hypothetical protein